MMLETARLLLQPFSQIDLLSFRQMNADPQVMEHYPAVLSIEQSAERLKESKATSINILLVYGA